MTQRPISLILAAGLLLLIGASGMAVGGSLLGAAGNGDSFGVDLRPAALALGTGIAAYGFVAVFAGVGLLLLRRWGWRVGVGIVVAGLVPQGFALVAAGPDAVIAFGIAIWGVTLACLIAPDTRRAVAAASPPADDPSQRDRR